MKRESPAALTSRRYPAFAESIIYRPRCPRRFAKRFQNGAISTRIVTSRCFPSPSPPVINFRLIYTLGVMQISRRETSCSTRVNGRRKQLMLAQCGINAAGLRNNYTWGIVLRNSTRKTLLPLQFFLQFYSALDRFVFPERVKIHSECDGEGEERGIGWTIIGPRTNSNSDETTRSVWSYVRNGRFGDGGMPVTREVACSSTRKAR